MLYNLVFTEWRHCVSENKLWGRGCYITLFSPSDITAFHRMNYAEGVLYNLVFTEWLRFTEWIMGKGMLYNLVFTEWRHCVSENELWGRGCYIALFSPSDVTAFHRMNYGEGVLYNLVFTEWRHCVSENELWGRGCYITLFSPSDVTAFQRMNYGEGGVI